jgi:hypothetical protein
VTSQVAEVVSHAGEGSSHVGEVRTTVFMNVLSIDESVGHLVMPC